MENEIKERIDMAKARGLGRATVAAEEVERHGRQTLWMAAFWTAAFLVVGLALGGTRFAKIAALCVVAVAALSMAVSGIIVVGVVAAEVCRVVAGRWAKAVPKPKPEPEQPDAAAPDPEPSWDGLRAVVAEMETKPVVSRENWRTR